MALSGLELTGIGITGNSWMARPPITPKLELIILFSSIGLRSIIGIKGIGVSSGITSAGISNISTITNSLGLLGIMQSRGKGVNSPITEQGESLESKL